MSIRQEDAEHLLRLIYNFRLEASRTNISTCTEHRLTKIMLGHKLPEFGSSVNSMIIGRRLRKHIATRFGNSN